MFVAGAVDVLRGYMSETAPTAQELKVRIAQYVPVELGVIEIGKGVDLFCGVPENAIVPVYNALKIVSLKAMGTPPAEIDKTAALMRKIANAIAQMPSKQ
jgi:hypothetical protein